VLPGGRKPSKVVPSEGAGDGLGEWWSGRLTGAFYGLLDGLGLAGMIIASDYGSFPKIPC